MPFFTLPDSSQLYFESIGAGPPMLLLHAGLGRYVDWFDTQIQAFSDYHLVIPDRLGYGRSTPVDHFSTDYHVRNADDVLMLLEGLSIVAPVVWGHSDGAVIAAWMAIKQPDRVRALVLEGTHLWRRKPGSLEAFRGGISQPESTFAERTIQRLQEGHGERWRQVVANWGNAWLALYEMEGDLYEGRLSEIQAPTLVFHGVRDPHTTVAEIKALTTQIPGAQLHVFPEAGHSPHSQRSSRDECNQRVRDFLRNNVGV